MGCCGDEEEEFLKHLMPNFSETLTLGSTSQASTSGDSDAVVSPMNSHFSALTCQDVLRGIFERLPVADLARASCVCRVWNLVASDRGIQVRAFKAPWKLKDVVGIPSSGSFWRDNSLGKFAISHRLVRGDSVASLAVKYSVQVLFGFLENEGKNEKKPNVLVVRLMYLILIIFNATGIWDSNSEFSFFFSLISQLPRGHYLSIWWFS